MVNNVVYVIAKLSGSNVDEMQFGACLIHRDGGVVALVVALELGEAAVKTVGDTALGVAGKDRNQARIDPPRNISADRHVAAQVKLYRVVEQLGEVPLEISCAVVAVDLIIDVPISPDANLAILDGQCMARQKLLDAAEQGGLADRVLEGQIFGERRRIGFDFGQKRQQCLCFGSKDKSISHQRIVEGLDAEAVARAEKTLAPVVPEGKGEHPAQSIEAAGVIAVVGCQNRLGVRVRMEFPAGGQLGAELEIIVDLAIIGDGSRARRHHRLLRGIAQVDDRQATMREPDRTRRRDPGAISVWAAVGEEAVEHRKPRSQSRNWHSVDRNHTRDAAHSVSFPGETELNRIDRHATASDCRRMRTGRCVTSSTRRLSRSDSVSHRNSRASAATAERNPAVSSAQRKITAAKDGGSRRSRCAPTGWRPIAASISGSAARTRGNPAAITWKKPLGSAYR